MTTEATLADVPTPTPAPAPSDTSTRLLEALKVFIVIVPVLGGQGAVLAYGSVLDWSKINDAGYLFHLQQTSWNGFRAGMISGAARSVQVVMAIWAGPTVWKYVAPVIGASAEFLNKSMRNFAALFKRSPPTEAS